MYTYETKCRRCGDIEIWSVRDEDYSWPLNFKKTFQRDMNKLIKEPKQHYCETCRKSTVHDLVSYTSA
jgi:hypothetical protein